MPAQYDSNHAAHRVPAKSSPRRLQLSLARQIDAGDGHWLHREGGAHWGHTVSCGVDYVVLRRGPKHHRAWQFSDEPSALMAMGELRRAYAAPVAAVPVPVTLADVVALPARRGWAPLVAA